MASIEKDPRVKRLMKGIRGIFLEIMKDLQRIENDMMCRELRTSDDALWRMMDCPTDLRKTADIIQKIITWKDVIYSYKMMFPSILPLLSPEQLEELHGQGKGFIGGFAGELWAIERVAEKPNMRLYCVPFLEAIESILEDITEEIARQRRPVHEVHYDHQRFEAWDGNIGRIGDWAMAAKGRIGLDPEDPENHQAGYLAIVGQDGTTALQLRVDQVHSWKDAEFRDRSVTLVRELLADRTGKIKSTVELCGQKAEKPGGAAIRTKHGAISFFGLPHLASETIVLVVALRNNWLARGDAKAIIEISQNPYIGRVNREVV